MLQNGSEAYHTVRHIPIIYGDYFLLEALMKIQGKGVAALVRRNVFNAFLNETEAGH